MVMSNKPFGITLVVIIGTVLLTFVYLYDLYQNPNQTQQIEEQSGLDIAIQNAKDFDNFIIDKIRNAETCDKMELYLLQYEEKFWSYDYRTMMFEEYDLRCLSEVED